VTGAVHRLEIPTPFLVGRVNCYLLTGDPLTLVDTGPNSGTALDTLEQGLAEHGVAIEDLELLVLTHQHMDHGGLLEIIGRRSGAEVAAFAPLVPWLSRYTASATADDNFAQALMRRHGVPDEIVTVLGLVAAAYRGYGSKSDVTRPLADGDALIMGGRQFTVLHRPGHSPSDLVFFEEQTGLLIGGDHLIGHISSNAIVTRPFDGPVDAPRPRPLMNYVASLKATHAMELSEVLAGHGDPVTDHRALIDERMRLHERRAAKIMGMLSPEPLTAHQLAGRIWGNVAVTQAYLTLSEVLGHIDLLLARDRVVEVDDGPVTRFQAR
jgi:glyoxylase-like metal-dependent hydrolase (beta-lactamase superfamily II)